MIVRQTAHLGPSFTPQNMLLAKPSATRGVLSAGTLGETWTDEPPARREANSDEAAVSLPNSDREPSLLPGKSARALRV
jgi:hypothetical protein